MKDDIKILIVEDESIVALELKSVLVSLSFDVVESVTNYDDALKCVKRCDIELILMDINLQNSKDGIETAQDILKIKKIPILYITAYSDDETIQRAVETEPIGYLIKPFKREDIKSAIMLSHYKIEQNEEVELYDALQDLGCGYYYDWSKESLYYNKMPIRLSERENSVLKLLLEANGEVVPFGELEYHLWGKKKVAKSSLRTVIYRLRSKLEHKLVETIPSFGCKIKSP